MVNEFLFIGWICFLDIPICLISNCSEKQYRGRKQSRIETHSRYMQIGRERGIDREGEREIGERWRERIGKDNERQNGMRERQVERER